MRRKSQLNLLLGMLALATASSALAQTPAPAAGGRGGRGAGAPARPPAYPDRPAADPAVVARGRALYGVHCTFCHGSDARGGEGGPNLLRRQVVLDDQNGEKIAPIVHNGIGEMPKIAGVTDAQVADIAAFIHSFRVGGYDVSRMTPPSIVVGDAAAGEAYFKATCASCHSVTGDLKGYGARFTDAKQLQQNWIMPGGGRGGRGAATPVTVTVTTPQGKVEGRLVRIDDFIVTLAEADGGQRTFRRDGENPKVELHDPRQPHKNLLPKYTDKDIHNLTAYLVTVK